MERRRVIHSLPDWLFTPRSQRWVRVAIIAAVFCVILLLSLAASMRWMMLVLALVVGSAGAVILLRKLQLGLLAIVFAALLVPSPFQSGAGASLTPPLVLVAMMLGLWLVDMIARQRQIRLVRSKTLLPAIAFLVATLISFLNGRIIYYTFTQVAPLTAQIGELAIFLFSFGAFLLVANLVDDVRWLERMTWLFLALGGVYIFARLFPFTERIIRPLFQYGSDASLFWVWLVALAAGQVFFNPKLGKRWKYALYALLAATLYVSLIQAYSWKSGWLPAVGALFVVLWVGLPRYRGWLLGLGILAVTMNFFVDVDRVVAGGEDYSILTRLEAWRIILEIVKINPILGLGLSNYYWYTPLFPIMGYSVRFNSHNNYIDIFAQVGLVGLACFMWFAWEAARLGWGLLKSVPVGFPKAFVIGALGGLAGSLASGMLGDWILPFVYNVGLHGFRSSIMFWLFLGGLVALEQIYRVSNTGASAD